MRASSLRRSTRLTSSAIWPGLGGGCRNRRLNTCRTCGTVNAGVFFVIVQAIGLFDVRVEHVRRGLGDPAVSIAAGAWRFPGQQRWGGAAVQGGATGGRDVLQDVP